MISESHKYYERIMPEGLGGTWMRSKRKKLYIILGILLLIAAIAAVFIGTDNFHSVRLGLKDKRNRTSDIRYNKKHMEKLYGIKKSSDEKTIIIYAEYPNLGCIGMQKGWFSYLVKNQFNVRLKICKAGPEDDASNCDIFVCGDKSSIKRYIKKNGLLIADEKEYEKYCINTYRNYPDHLYKKDGKVIGIKDFKTPTEEIWTVNKKSENMDISLCILDWLATYTVREECSYGPITYCWNYKKDGNLKFTDHYYDCRFHQVDFPDKYGGGSWFYGMPYKSMINFE